MRLMRIPRQKNIRFSMCNSRTLSLYQASKNSTGRSFCPIWTGLLFSPQIHTAAFGMNFFQQLTSFFYSSFQSSLLPHFTFSAYRFPTYFSSLLFQFLFLNTKKPTVILFRHSITTFLFCLCNPYDLPGCTRQSIQKRNKRLFN